jgi:hypothetical protein
LCHLELDGTSHAGAFHRLGAGGSDIHISIWTPLQCRHFGSRLHLMFATTSVAGLPGKVCYVVAWNPSTAGGVDSSS